MLFPFVNTEGISPKMLPAVMVNVFLLIALSAFIARYRNLEFIDLPAFGQNKEESTLFFFLNFYSSFFLTALSLYGILLSPQLFIKTVFSVSAFIFSVVAVYILKELFTIKLSIYAACIITNASVFYPPKSLIVNGIYILFYSLLLFCSPFMGTVSVTFASGRETQFFQNLMVIMLLSELSFLITHIRFLSDKNKKSEETIKHLNSIITQLTVFNHRLQEYAKTSGEDAIKKERLRFTRDLHDKCGYVFTLINTMAEAALSYNVTIPNNVEQVLQRIKKQAKDGLRQTREALYLIREIEEPWTGSIDAVYQMKSIFENVTGVKVEIETGNIRQSYGRTINKVLIKILQEAFTNSIRHGKASYILIHFWEFAEELTMTVTDNGMGTQMVVKRIGLAGMEERLAAVGGNLETSLPEGGGFRIRVRIPFSAVKDKENFINNGPANG
jgi:signal transduction histidine kinase